MKKLLTLAAGIALTATAACAQTLSIGPTGSIGHSFISNVPSPYERDFKISGSLGIGLVWSNNSHWGLGTGLAVSHEGFAHEDKQLGGTKVDMVVNPIYLRMPVNFIYFFGDQGDRIRPKVYIGPSVAVKVDEAYDYSIDNKGNGSDNLHTGGDMFRRFDVGAQAGVGMNIKVCKNTWLNIDGSYYRGFLDATNPDNENGMAMTDGYNVNQNLRLNLGLMWGL